MLREGIQFIAEALNSLVANKRSLYVSISLLFSSNFTDLKFGTNSLKKYFRINNFENSIFWICVKIFGFNSATERINNQPGDPIKGRNMISNLSFDISL